MKFDEIVIQIGEFGPYQRKVYGLMVLIALPVAMVQVGHPWLAGEPDHWCVSPELKSVNCSSFNLSPTECEQEKKEASIPKEGDEFSECERYNLTGIPFYPGVNISDDTETLSCDAGWIYDDSIYEATVVTDFDLVCEKRNLPDLSSSIYFAGLLVGSVLYGAIADKFGRYPAFFIGIFMEVVVGVSVMFSPNFITFTILRFILGTSNMGLFILGSVIGTELLGPSKRVLGIMGMQMGFSIGFMLLALLAFLIRSWRVLQFVMCAPVVLFFLLMPIIPESPRWLITQGNYAKAEKIIQKAAKVNGKKLPDPLFNEAEMQMQRDQLKNEPQATVLDLFKTPNLRKNTLNMMWNWFVCSLIFYGLSLYTSDLGGNIYISFFISGAVEVPAVIYSTFAIEWFGRRINLAGVEILAGICCIASIVIPLGVGRTTVAMIGKFCAKAAFCIVYIHSAEIFPTPVRSIGMGISSMASRVGGIVSPLISILGDYWFPLPWLIIGSCSLLAGFLALLLPETVGKNLPETIEEGEAFGKKKSSYNMKNDKSSVEQPPSLEEHDNPTFEDVKV